MPFPIPELDYSLFGVFALAVFFFVILVSYNKFFYKKIIDEKLREWHKWINIILIFLVVIFLLYGIASISYKYPQSNSFRIVISPFQIIESSSNQNEYDIGTPNSIKSAIETTQKNIEVIIPSYQEAVHNPNEAKAISEKYNSHIVIYGKIKNAYLGEKKNIECSIFISEKIKNRDTITYRDNLNSSLLGLRDFNIQNFSDITNFEGELDDNINFILGLESYISGNYSDSVVYLTNISNKYLNSDTYVYMGTAQMEMKMFNESIDSYENAIKLNPNNTYAWWNFGLLNQKIGRINKSIECFNSYISLDPASPDAWINNGVNYQRLGDYNSALKFYSRPLERNPNYAPSLNNIGQLEVIRGNLTEAEKYINRVIEISPNSTSGWVNRGVIYRLKGDYISSIASFDHALSTNPDNPEIWYLKGLSYFEMQKYDETIVCMNKVIDVKSSDYSAEVYLGQAYGELMQWEMAKKAFKRAIEIDPAQDVAQKNLEALTNREKYLINSSICSKSGICSNASSNPLSEICLNASICSC